MVLLHNSLSSSDLGRYLLLTGTIAVLDGRIRSENDPIFMPALASACTRVTVVNVRQEKWHVTELVQMLTLGTASSSSNSMNANRMAEFGSPQTCSHRHDSHEAKLELQLPTQLIRLAALTLQSCTLPQSSNISASSSSVTWWKAAHQRWRANVLMAFETDPEMDATHRLVKVADVHCALDLEIELLLHGHFAPAWCCRSGRKSRHLLALPLRSQG